MYTYDYTPTRLPYFKQSSEILGGSLCTYVRTLYVIYDETLKIEGRGGETEKTRVAVIKYH